MYVVIVVLKIVVVASDDVCFGWMDDREEGTPLKEGMVRHRDSRVMSSDAGSDRDGRSNERGCVKSARSRLL